MEDVLSWDKFFYETNKNEFYPPKKIDLYNRLVAFTDNFFVIAAIGAFTPGYLMIVTKKMLPSFCLIESSQMKELKWLINILEKEISKYYNRNVVLFEHGMCACVGGLDRAHLHLMTVDKKADNSLLKECVNRALIRRKAGITHVEFKGHKLENIHDINQIMSSNKKNEYSVHGKQLAYNDISKDLDIKNWPAAAINHVKAGGHYVFFKTNSENSSFFTKKNFQTQLGREIVFELEKETNASFSKWVNDTLKVNSYSNIWKWQEFPFNENILKTMNDFTEIASRINDQSKQFGFISVKPKK